MRIRLLVTLLASMFAAAAMAGPAAAADLQKAISMGGPQSLRSDDHPNDYRLWGNREYVGDSGTGWVKLWVSWNDLQGTYQPTSRSDSWSQLDTTANLTRLDAQVRAANADGVHVLLGIYQAFPTWASGATGPDPLSTKPAIQKLPLDLSPDGPWGWFVGYLSNRYSGSSVLAGRIDALEVVNEPNLLYWPQDTIAADTATMLKSAEQLSYTYGRQAIAGPGTSDYPDPGGSKPGVNTDWQTFTTGVLDALTGWQPRVPVHWSQHNYRDVKYEDAPETSRAKQTIDLLASHGWPEAQLWLTEGGLNLGSSWADPATRDAQAAKIQKNFEAMKTLPQVALWTQHGMNDIAGNSFKSGLRDDFDPSLPGPGAARPAWSTWMTLDGTRPVEPPPSPPPPTDTGTTTTPTDTGTTTTPTDTTATAASSAPAANAPASAQATPDQAAPAPDASAPDSTAPAAPPSTADPGTQTVTTGSFDTVACELTAPTAFRRALKLDGRRRITLPRTRLGAAATSCSATVTLAGSIHAQATLRIRPGKTSAIRITLPKSAPARLPAKATLKIVLTSPGQPTQKLSWRVRLKR